MKTFFKFTRGRFVSDEAEQMAQRHVRFDMNELARVAAKSAKAKKCVDIEKCPDGLYNKAFLMTMDDGTEVLAKVPNPNTGIPHYTTASEVATMDFIRNVLNTPVPEVYSWNSKANNPVGTEHTIMEFIRGVPLQKVWASFAADSRLKIFLQVFRYVKAWSQASFPQLGSLYYASDITGRLADHLYVDSEGTKVVNDRFAVGPAVGREWIDEGRVLLDCDRGPWNDILDYRKAIVFREKVATEKLPRVPKQTAIAYGPKLYVPTAINKLEALNAYLKALESGALLPISPELISGHLWHDDLQLENIFVDPKDPTKIIGIIDWQATTITPMFDHQVDPSFLEYEGPDVVCDNLDAPELPDDWKTLPNLEREAVLQTHTAHSVKVAWRRSVKKKNTALYSAMQFQETSRSKLLIIPRRLFEIGETHVLASLLALRDELDSSESFPLTFSKSQVAKIEDDFAKTCRGMDIMKAMEHNMGDLWPDKGVVSHENYQAVKEAIRKEKKEIEPHLVSSDEDKIVFERHWPFDD